MRQRYDELAERISLLQSKIDSGRFKYAEKQERDRLVEEFLKLEQETCRRCRNLRDDDATTCATCRKEME